jgi:hypothetical protein
MYLVSTELCSLVGFILIEPFGAQTPIDLVFTSLLSDNACLMHAKHVELIVHDSIIDKTKTAYRVMYIDLCAKQVIPISDTAPRNVVSLKHGPVQPKDFPIAMSLPDFTDGAMKRLIVGYMIMDATEKNNVYNTCNHNGTLILDHPVVTNEYGIFCMYCSGYQDSHYYVVFDRPDQCVSVYNVSNHGNISNNVLWGEVNEVKKMTMQVVNKHSSRLWLLQFKPQFMMTVPLVVLVLPQYDIINEEGVVMNMLMDVINTNQIYQSKNGVAGNDVLLSKPFVNDTYEIFGMHYYNHNSQYFLVFHKNDPRVSVYRVSQQGIDQSDVQWGSIEEVTKLIHKCLTKRSFNTSQWLQQRIIPVENGKFETQPSTEHKQVLSNAGIIGDQQDHKVIGHMRIDVVVHGDEKTKATTTTVKVVSSNANQSNKQETIYTRIMEVMKYKTVNYEHYDHIVTDAEDIILEYPVVNNDYGILCMHYYNSDLQYYVVFDRKDQCVSACCIINNTVRTNTLWASVNEVVELTTRTFAAYQKYDPIISNWITSFKIPDDGTKFIAGLNPEAAIVTYKDSRFKDYAVEYNGEQYRLTGTELQDVVGQGDTITLHEDKLAHKKKRIH